MVVSSSTNSGPAFFSDTIDIVVSFSTKTGLALFVTGLIYGSHTSSTR